jgi:hypothetical protein
MKKWRAEVEELRRHLEVDWQFCQEFVAKFNFDFHAMVGRFDFHAMKA